MVKIPCGICTTPIESGHHRYGGSSCDACASFFIRNASTQKDFKCVVGSNDCLKNASKLGKGCRRCRYDKCLDIGMSTNETIKIVKEVKQQETSLPLPAHYTQLTPESQVKETELEKNTVFAYIIDSVLNISLSSPTLTEEYLVEANQELITTSFTKVAGSSLTQLTEKIYYLRECLNFYQLLETNSLLFISLFCGFLIFYPAFLAIKPDNIKNEMVKNCKKPCIFTHTLFQKGFEISYDNIKSFFEIQNISPDPKKFKNAFDLINNCKRMRTKRNFEQIHQSLSKNVEIGYFYAYILLPLFFYFVCFYEDKFIPSIWIACYIMMMFYFTTQNFNEKVIGNFRWECDRDYTYFTKQFYKNFC
uniref:Nuclear receptor domain-containing protein n=1 Tax=Panagrolaimus sp. PS1159 TaxID=55785 RepID=A0AC35FKG7_9BILA